MKLQSIVEQRYAYLIVTENSCTEYYRRDIDDIGNDDVLINWECLSGDMWYPLRDYNDELEEFYKEWKQKNI